MPFRTGVSLKSIIDGLGLTTGLKLVLDAGDSASYSSGQKWLDQSGNGYDFFLGATGSVEASDPVFSGTPGGLSTSEYWGGFNDAKFFRYDSANEAWMQNLHKDNAKFTCIVWFYSSIIGQAFFGTNGGGPGSGTGVSFGYQASPGPNSLAMRVANGGVSSLDKLSTATIAADNAWHFAAVSVDEAAGASGGLFQLDATQETFDATYTSPGVGSASFTMEVAARGNGSAAFRPNNRLAIVAMWEGVALTTAQLNDIYKNAVALGLTKANLTLSGKAAILDVIAPVTKANLTLSGKAAILDVIAPVTKGNLTLSGKTASLLISTALSSGTLTLVGRNSILTLEQPSANGTLHLAPRDSSFLVIDPVTKGDLTLSGQASALLVSTALSSGTLALSGNSSSLDVIAPVTKGDLVLTGKNIDGVFPLHVEPATLRLVPREIDLIAIGGGNGGDDKRRRKKPRTGFEPIAKQPDRKIIIKRDDFLPPDDLFDDGAPLVPSEPPPQPDFVEPDAIMAMRADITTAQDLSDIERILRDMDLDEQDLSDIMDILELID